MYINNIEILLLKKIVLVRGDLEGLYEMNLYYLLILG